MRLPEIKDETGNDKNVDIELKYIILSALIVFVFMMLLASLLELLL